MSKSTIDISKSLNDAVAIATSIAYTKKQISKLEEKLSAIQTSRETIVEYIQGPQGKEGPRGFMGPQGIQGETGAKGDKGDRGDKGEDGKVGPMGLRGEQGERGQKGDKGDKGDKGEKGDRGEIGPQGIQGEKGDKGDTGATGAKGDKGDTGEKGDRGPKGEKGDRGLDGKSGEKGDKGDRGERGPQGAKGDKGDTGEKGEQGIPGERGPQGEPGKPADRVEIEAKLKEYRDALSNDLQEYKKSINAAVTRSMGYKSAGGGEVNLRFLDDVDTSNLADGKVIAYNETTKKFEFVVYESGTTLSIQNEGFNLGSANVINFVGDAVSTTVNANGVATVTVSGTGTATGQITDALKVVFDNSTATPYKLVALNPLAETVLASATDITQVDKVLGVLNVDGETITNGIIQNEDWSWTPEQALFLGQDGNIVTTSTVDGAAFSLKIGYAISSTIIYIKLGTPVIL